MLPCAALALIHLTENPFGPDLRYPWLPPALNGAYRERVLVAYPDDNYMGRGRLPSTYEYAVVTHAVVQTGIQRAERALTTTDDLDRAALIRFARFLPSLVRAGTVFRKELDALGVPTEFGQTRLTGLLGQMDRTSPVRDHLFRDVPADHWAAKAVGDLRALGLLDGYPDGKFRG